MNATVKQFKEFAALIKRDAESGRERNFEEELEVSSTLSEIAGRHIEEIRAFLEAIKSSSFGLILKNISTQALIDWGSTVESDRQYIVASCDDFNDLFSTKVGHSWESTVEMYFFFLALAVCVDVYKELPWHTKEELLSKKVNFDLFFWEKISRLGLLSVYKLVSAMLPTKTVHVEDFKIEQAIILPEGVIVSGRP